MALLTIDERKERFKALGLEYNTTGIKTLQKKYFKKSKDRTGKYDANTDVLLRHVYNVKTYTKNFSPQEFRCPCGKCTGYPTFMRKVELQHLQSIRSHYGKPVNITSGLRCKSFNNSLRGSSKNSKHLTGYAADFYIKGVTDTLSGRKKLIKYVKTLPNHNWTYGNGWCSKGYKISAPNMGDAIHTDTTAPKVSKTKPVYSITVDLTNQVCTLYYGSKVVMSEFCSTARPGYSTPTGTYKIGKSKGRCAKARTALLAGGTTYAEHLVRFNGGKCFHGVPSKKRNKVGIVKKNQFNKLGSVASGGCVRLPWKMAKAIYDKCPVGTKVKIYKGKAGEYPAGKPTKYKATTDKDPTYKK